MFVEKRNEIQQENFSMKTTSSSTIRQVEVVMKSEEFRIVSINFQKSSIDDKTIEVDDPNRLKDQEENQLDCSIVHNDIQTMKNNLKYLLTNQNKSSNRSKEIKFDRIICKSNIEPDE